MGDNVRGSAVLGESSHRDIMKEVAQRWFEEHRGQPMAMNEFFHAVNSQLLAEHRSEISLPQEELVRSLLSLMDQRVIKWDSSLRLVPAFDVPGDE